MINWFARNSVAANLLMAVIIGFGLYSAANRLPLEVFPSFELDQVNITVPYRGATPEEVEQGVVLRVEEAIYDLQGVKEIRSRASEGLASITATVKSGVDPDDLLSDIRGRVDSLSTLPKETERPRYLVPSRLSEVLSVAVAADLPLPELRRLADQVRDDIVALEGVTQVTLSAPAYEIGIEVSRQALSQYGLTLEEIRAAIQRSSLDLSAGQIRSAGGDFLLRTRGQAFSGDDYRKVVLRAGQDGRLLQLGDIAEIRDGLQEDVIQAYFNGRRAMFINVLREGKQSAIQIANTVKAHLDEKAGSWPANADVSYWADRSRIVKGRLGTLTKSALQGGLLIFVLLSLFLRFKVAIWVCVGIPLSFCGALAMMPELGATINILSLFAFIVVLGIVVDDAIVTGESIYSTMQETGDSLRAAIEGTHRVAVPVTFGVLTTAAAFVPLAFMEGFRGKLFIQIPMIVIPVLMFSLIESKLILPAHLKNMKVLKPEELGTFGRFQRRFADGFETLILRGYQPLLKLALEYRYVTLAIFIAALALTIGAINGGRVGFTFFPRVPNEVATANLTMPAGTPVSLTQRHVTTLSEAAKQTQLEFSDADGRSIIKNIFSMSGAQVRLGSGPERGQVMLELESPEVRSLNVSTREVVNRWRELAGEIPGSKSLNYLAEIGRGSQPLDVQMSAAQADAMLPVADKIKARLAEYAGVYGIGDTLSDGKQQIELFLKPEAEALGVSRAALAQQLRGAFFGLEAERIQRGRHDIRVMLRLPQAQRSSLSDLEQLRIRTNRGEELALGTVAELRYGRSSSAINRIDRQRVASVTADFDKKTVDAEAIKRDLNLLATSLADEYPQVSISQEGEAKEQQESFGSLLAGTVFVLFAIYGLLAIPLKSYSQPLMVMSIIPFGLIGAVLGHLFLGLNLSLLSAMGVLALTGVVVNDSLVLVDYVNQQRRDGKALFDAVATAGAARFRAVILTSLTTFVGLVPLIFEKSTQAQFLIPMGVSLGFGILFATLITLILIPCNYLILADAKKALNSAFASRTKPAIKA